MMIKRIFLTTVLGALMVAGMSGIAWWRLAEQAEAATRRVVVEAEQRRILSGLVAGLPIYIRIFKQESQLELWMQKDDRWHLYSTFPICTWSGQLGPKLKEGDRQSPEGFYKVTKASLNPNSSYHLSFNLGFPNAYDKSHGRTGSFLMVHGDCVSIGCYAMTNPGIESIYGFVEAALDAGQNGVPVHVYPFRLSDQNMAKHAQSIWFGFWGELKPAFDYFESNRQIPHVSVLSKRYSIKPPS